MSSEQHFRWLFVAIFLTVFAISSYFRSKARKTGEVIPRVREGKLTLALRLLFAAPLFLSVLAYMMNPEWMAWSSTPLPTWLRWVGTAVGLSTVPWLFWVFRTLGSNVSETVLTKQHHTLVTRGPYRWVRHPLYVGATAAFLSLGIVAANWFIMAMAFTIIIAVAVVVIPREEAHLMQKFGDEYREYRKRTGRLTPRLTLFG